jgi:solute carrier family 35 protein E2
VIKNCFFSVANTIKRGMLIWLSVMAFGNQISSLNWLGTALVIVGVMVHSKAQLKANSTRN